MSASAWITNELAADAVETWQPYYARQLTHDGVIETLLAVGNLINSLERIDDQAILGPSSSIEPMN